MSDYEIAEKFKTFPNKNNTINILKDSSKEKILIECRKSMKNMPSAYNEMVLRINENNNDIFNIIKDYVNINFINLYMNIKTNNRNTALIINDKTIIGCSKDIKYIEITANKNIAFLTSYLDNGSVIIDTLFDNGLVNRQKFLK